MSARAVACCVLALLGMASGTANAGEGVVALQTAAASCPDGSGARYVACGNGTVTDNDTGLVWLANANCFGSMGWHEAMAVVAGLSDLADDGTTCTLLASQEECDCGLSDGSSPGEWRLPSITEWDEMMEHAADVLGCSPAITTDPGNACYSTCAECAAPLTRAPPCTCSFYGVVSSAYWSSSTLVNGPSSAWCAGLDSGTVLITVGKTLNANVWPVRGGQ